MNVRLRHRDGREARYEGVENAVEADDDAAEIEIRYRVETPVGTEIVVETFDALDWRIVEVSTDER